MLKRYRIFNFWHFFNLWHLFTPRVHSQRLKIIEELSRDCSSQSLLDVACGNLPYTSYSNLQPSLKVAFDFNAEYIRNARKKQPSYNYLIASAETLPFREESFDFVFAGEMIEHLKQPEAFLEETNMILKKGGYLLIDTPNYAITKWFEILSGEKHGISVGHVKEFTVNEFQDEIKKSGFSIYSERGVYTPLSLFLPIPVLVDLSMALGNRLPRLSYLTFLLAKKTSKKPLDS